MPVGQWSGLMRYSSLLFFILLLSSQVSASLYESLKNLPQPREYNSFKPFYGTGLVQTDKMFSYRLDQYWMSSMLQKQFIVYNKSQGKDYIVEDINVNESMSSDARQLTEDTIYTQVAMITAIGVLVVLPESISKWDMDALQEQSLSERWVENVTTKPVWDQDDWVINYIGHPVSGAVYYAMARNDGFSIFGSALYSTVMSTFFWEYGYESFAETPSIQDLIFTPLIGSFLGEGMHVLEGILDENEGVIWGSKGLGSFSYFWLDPMGNIAHGLGDTFDISVTMEFTNFTHHADLSQFRYSNDHADPVRFEDRDYGFMLTFY